MKLKPVEFDPFAEQAPQGAKLRPVDFDPFAKAPQQAMADDPGTMGTLAIAAGRQADRLVKGVKQMGLNVAAPFSDSARGELANMAQQEAENSRLYAPLQKARPWSTGIGEALPLVAAPMLGAGAAGMAASAALPGLIEYGSGEERLKRGALGAAGGALGNFAGNAIARAVKPTEAVSKSQQAAIDAADRLGIKLTSGEASGNRALRWAESAASDMPLASGIASKRFAANDKAMAQAASRAIGQNADELTENVFSSARQNLSGEFDRILTPIQIDLTNRATQAELNAVTGSKVLKGLRDESVDGLINEIRTVAAQGPVSGQWFQQNKTALDAAIRSAYNNGQPGKAKALEGVENALDRAAKRAMGNDADAYEKARKQWANLRMLETGKVTENGKVMPGRLKSAMENRYKNAFKEGAIEGELADIAKASSILRQPPQSGTAPRAFYGGAAGGMAALEPMTLAATVGAPTVLQGVTASPLMRNYMTKGLLNLSPEEEKMLRAFGGRAGLLGAYGASQ